MRSWMGTRISLGRIAGVEVGFTWSFLVILGLFVVSLAAGVFPTSNPGLGTATYIAMGVVAERSSSSCRSFCTSLRTPCRLAGRECR